MKTKTLAELEEKHAEAIAKATKERAIAEVLPVEPEWICIHRDHASATYKVGAVEAALDLIQTFDNLGETVPCEHWNDGCVSTWPRSINSAAEKGKLEGSSAVELKLHSYGHTGEYKEAEFSFWINAAGGLVDVNIKVPMQYEWLPAENAKWHRGEVSSYSVTPRFLGEDIRRKFWSTPGCFQFCYYWKSMHSFKTNGPQRKVVVK